MAKQTGNTVNTDTSNVWTTTSNPPMVAAPEASDEQESAAAREMAAIDELEALRAENAALRAAQTPVADEEAPTKKGRTVKMADGGHATQAPNGTWTATPGGSHEA